MSFLKAFFIDSGLIWAVLGIFAAKIVDFLVGLYNRKKESPWVDLVADLAETAYRWTEEHSIMKSYPKLGDFMVKFADLWFQKTGRSPDPETQGSAVMIAASLADAEKKGKLDLKSPKV